VFGNAPLGFRLVDYTAGDKGGAIQAFFLIGVAVVFGGMLAGWILRERFFRLGEVLYLGAAALTRLLVAVGLGWSTYRVLKSPDVLHIGAAVILCVLALWLALIAALMLYGLAREEGATGSSTSKSP
jgi:hypothetical protein